MSAGTAFGIVVLVGVITYTMRAVVVLALADRAIPVPVERALRNVGPAVLAALAINLAAGGEGGPHLEFAEAAAMVVAGFTGWWKRNLLVSLISGMATLWVLSAVIG